MRAAKPVLDRLEQTLADGTVSLVLTDAAGRLLDRRVGDPPLRKHLDRIRLAPGFSYAEEYVGTNGIGTALQTRQTTLGWTRSTPPVPAVGCPCRAGAARSATWPAASTTPWPGWTGRYSSSASSPPTPPTTNLLDNADRHAESTITLNVRGDPGVAVLEVIDDGSGIDPEKRELVFQRFARLDAARAKDAGGTGLGLPIARQIAESSGGTLRIEDSERGARFVVRLPRLTEVSRSPG
ncbi:hypothetical protein Aph01nite_17040 [Acrocarpospora phusangensis]|uniref:histidine kinase n=1 Tax=Acrocarpospora phusangensis TaxID=1070424 RepID=A0A919Q8Y8_9ACTN|nr:ATP-binding protein [Acrocarpospora phusangensis]GIH23394.1 hypothetical protein Aph01nite_17040 [Acrocarpospora phusangensis]